MGVELIPGTTPLGIGANLLTSRGSMVAAGGAADPHETLAQQEAQTPCYHVADPNGIVWENPIVGQRGLAAFANPGLATFSTYGYAAAPGITGGANADDAFGPWVKCSTAATANVAVGFLPTTFTLVRPGWMPDTEFVVNTDATITLMRITAGLASAAIAGAATIPNTVHGAYFKFETQGAVTQWQCCVAAGGAPTVVNSGVVVAASTMYRLRIEFVGTLGSAPTSVRFLINNVLVATISATLPAANQTMTPLAQVTTLSAAIRAFGLSRVISACPI